MSGQVWRATITGTAARVSTVVERVSEDRYLWTAHQLPGGVGEGGAEMTLADAKRAVVTAAVRLAGGAS